jgi:2-keto-3-deoxy-L-rhamnonate aldolase RhmA
MSTAVPDSDPLSQAMEKTGRAAKNAGKFAGCVAVTAPTLVLAMTQGYRLIAGGGDVPFFRAAAAKKLEELRAVIASHT